MESRNNILLIKQKLREDHQELKSWRRVADKYNISKGMAYRVATDEGYFPRGILYRLKLGVEPIVPIKKMGCPHCGEKIKYQINPEICPYCNSHYLMRDMHEDHIIPVRRSGPDAGWNKVHCCRECNVSKNDRNPWDWIGSDWEAPEPFKDKFEAVKEVLESQEIQEDS